MNNWSSVEEPLAIVEGNATAALGGTDASAAKVAYMMRAFTYSCRRPNSTTKKEVGACDASCI